MSIDPKELIKMTNELRKFSSGYEKFLYNFLLKMGMRAMGQTKALTPVDTGNLRNTWFLSAIRREGNYLIIDLINTSVYASFVEDGQWQHARWVPGRWVGNRFEYIPNFRRGMMLREKWIPGFFMAKVSIERIEREMPKRFNAELKQFLKQWPATNSTS